MDPSLLRKSGAQFGPYVLGPELGRGGSAVVYAAEPTDSAALTLGRSQGPIAIKIQHLDQPEARQRFVREIETLRELRIPGIAEIYDAGEKDNLLWFSMQRINGLDFREKLQKIQNIQARALAAAQLGVRLCEILMSIHRHGYIHRDIKPGNVLVDDRNELTVLDFGVVQGTVAGTPITMPGSVLGTFPFMAPEQIAGLRLSGKVDVFAAGLLIYEGITGPRKAPAKPHEWLSIQCLERPTPLACIDPNISRRISAVVHQMLSFHPDDRPSAQKAAEMLTEALRKEGPEEWPDPPLFIAADPSLQQLVLQVEGKGPRVAFLSGPSGSGRRRLSNQLQRRAILRGTRTLKSKAKLDQPGGAVGSWLHQLLGRNPSSKWRDHICGPDGPLLAVMWPALPVIWTVPDHWPNVQQVAEAAVRVLIRAAKEQPLLLVIEDFDHADSMTCHVVEALAKSTEKTISLICIRNPRWETARVSQIVEQLLTKQCATEIRPPVLDPIQADRLVQSLVPGVMLATPGSGSAQRVTEHGLQALAKWRGEEWPRAPKETWLLALAQQPLPVGVLQFLDLDPETLLKAGILRGSMKKGFEIHNQALRNQCHSFLEDRELAEDRLAIAIAAAWVKDPRAHAAQARHRLYGSQPEKALVPAIDAALHAMASGRLSEARRWLLLIDQLPRDPDNEAYQSRRFDLAMARAQVGMATQPRAPRADLVGQARRRARTPKQKARARLLEATLEAQYGTGELAIAQLTSLINEIQREHPSVAVEALAEQGDLFLQNGDYTRSRAAVVRAEELRGGRQPDVIQTRLDRIRADALAAVGALQQTVQRCNAALSLAADLDLQQAQVRLRLRLGWVRLQMRQLDEATTLAWHARAQHQGDMRLGFAVENTLILAEIGLLQSNLTSCRRLLRHAEQALEDRPHPILRLHWQRLRLALATTRGDSDTARTLIAEVGTPEVPNFHWMLTEARWWMEAGQSERAQRSLEPLLQVRDLPEHLSIETQRIITMIHFRNGRYAQAKELATTCAKRARAVKLDMHALSMDLLLQSLSPEANRQWGLNLQQALNSPWSDLQLWSLELDAFRAERNDDIAQAKDAWRQLIERAQLLGHLATRTRALACLRALELARKNIVHPDGPTEK